MTLNHRANDSAGLVEQARAGNEQAVADLLGLYRNYMRLLARVHVDANLQSKADPSDLVQEACLQAIRDFRQFRGHTEAEFIAWLRQIVTNTGTAMIRRYKKTQLRDVERERRFQRQLDHSSVALERLAARRDEAPSRIADRRESAVVLADALAQLPEDYRNVLVLFHLESLPLADVAERMGRTIASARGLRTRALVKLRMLIEELT